MRISLVCPSLQSGGAERAVVTLSAVFLSRGHEVAIITVAARPDFYRIPVGVERFELDMAVYSPTPLHGLCHNIRRLRALRRLLHNTRPDVVISHVDQTNVLTTLATAWMNFPVIVVENVDSSIFSPGRTWKTMRHFAYRWASKVVSVSKGVDLGLTWLPEHHRRVIHNPIVLPPPNTSEGTPLRVLSPGRSRVIAMGRLVHQKGFDLLLTAFQRISQSHPTWELVIIGEGELRRELECQRNAAQLSDRVRFTGAVHDPFPLLEAADLFAMASRYEGLPYALLEAMACGLPVIYTDCPSGPSEIIRHGVDGLLVPNGDINALVDALDKLMSDEKARRCLAIRAPEVLN